MFAFETEYEKDKFEHIFSKYKSLLIYKAYQITHDLSLAEDAASEAFLRIYKNLHKITHPDANQSVAFYVTITKNAALTIVSKNKGSSTDLLDEAFPDSTDVEQTVLEKSSCDAIYRALDKLSEDMRNVFLLKFAYDLPHKEIAGQLGLSENNVTVIIHRTKKALAKILAKEGYENERT